MPVITRINRQTKNPSRASIFLDGCYGFSLSTGEVARYSEIRTGQELSPEQISEFKQVSEVSIITSKLIRMIALRRRSILEAKRAYMTKHLREDLVDKALEELVSLKLLDDRAFCDWWIESRTQSQNPKSRAVIEAELYSKGINRSIISESMSEMNSRGGGPENTDMQSLVKLLTKVSHRYSDDRKLMQYLAGRGFKYADIKEAVKQLRV